MIDGIDLPGFLVPRLRLQFARLGIPASFPPHDRDLHDWLDSQPWAATIAGAVEFYASLAADLNRLRWAAAGETSAFLPAVERYFRDLEADSTAVEQFTGTIAQLAPPRIGSWIEVTPDYKNAGWFVPDKLSLARARRLAGYSAANTTLGAWAARHGVTTCAWAGRGVGVGNPATEFRMPLPPGNDEQQVLAALNLFTGLGVPAPPDRALGALLNLEQHGFEVALSLSATGLTKVGLLVARPSLPLIIELGRTAAVHDFDIVAAFQGMLGVSGPEYAEYHYRSKGFGLELHYRVTSDAHEHRDAGNT